MLCTVPKKKFKEEVFKEEEFVSSNLTPAVCSDSSELTSPLNQQSTSTVSSISQMSSSSDQRPKPCSSVSLEEIRPLPKHILRKQTKRGRPKGKSLILTDDAEEEKQKTIKSKNSAPSKKKAKIHLKDVECGNLIETEMFENDLEINLQNESTNNDELQIGDFVLVRFLRKTTVKYYVANIIEVHGNEFIVEYLKNIENSNKFTKTKKDAEKFEVDRDDIILKLPAPNVVGRATTRRGQQLSFPMSFDGYNLG